jgi:tetratricopeptide (TPR) repeat protein
MKTTFFLIAMLITSSLWSQSLDNARSLFERFEYASAAKEYSEILKAGPVPLEDYKRIGYAYFIIGEYESCLPISDSILNTEDVEPFFYYMNGEVNMGQRNYEQARKSYEKYVTLDTEYDVSLKLESCKLIPNWKPETYLVNTHLGENTTKADITGPNFGEQYIRYSEVGKDSLGDHVHNQNIDKSELILAKPLIGSGNSFGYITISDSITGKSISSLSFFPNGVDVLLSISRPMEKEQIDMVPHIYKGTYNSSSNEIANLKLWEYSGYEDSSACTHATINASGNVIVFTKMSERTNGADLYMSTLSNGVWSQPKELSGLNTGYDEMYPLFMGDTLLSMASDGRLGYGGLDVYTSKVNGTTFAAPTHIKSPVNSFKDDFNFCYYSIDSARYTSNRIGGIGDDDMYFVKFSEPFVAPLDDSTDFNNFVDNWNTPIIYFDFDKFNISKDVDDISGLIAFLKEFTNSSIEIEGHTDRRGYTDYNYNLGYKRASTVKEELIKRGVREGQIKVSSKGESDPQFDCSKGCSEGQHSKNRVALINLDAK